MNTEQSVVLRYRRTDQDRLGEWAPVSSTWMTAASAGLVAHDVYHHLPTDTGTFENEVVSLGAEWYIDVQRPAVVFEAWPTSSFERNVTDTVLNALDSREERPFELPLRHAHESLAVLSQEEVQYFLGLARKMKELLFEPKRLHFVTDGPQASDLATFEPRFFENLVWGYVQAKARFPDQQAARKGKFELAGDLAALDKSDVPDGHEVTLTLNGYKCDVTYTDADIDFVQGNELVPAYMMTWCSCEHGYPAKHGTLHRTTREYAEHVSEFLDLQEEQDRSPELYLIPEDEQHGLRQVYVRDAAIQAQLNSGAHVQLPVSLMHMSDFTPRGVRVI